MLLLIFALLFVVINVVLLRWAETQLGNRNEYVTSYNTFRMKGTVRGILGKFESENGLGVKRTQLQNKNAKF